MHLLPRVRLELARRPWLYWSCVALCALVVWWGVHSATAAAQHERQRWGTARTVMVATRSVPAGQPIVARTSEFPVAMVPSSAVRTLAADAVAARPIAAGEVIVAGAVAGAQALPTDWVVFAIDRASTPALVAGDAVSVFADGTRWCEGRVAHTEPEQVDVAVPPECAAALSAHLAAGTVVLARGG